MEKLTSLSEIIKQSINQVLKNELLGFFVKSRLLTVLVGVVFMLPIMIPVFSLMGNINKMEQDYKSSSVPTQRVYPLDMNNGTSNGITYEENKKLDIMDPAPNNLNAPVPEISDLMPGIFEIILFIVGGLLLTFYGIAAINMHTLTSLRVAEGTAVPIKPLLVLSFKRAGVMFAHMVVKGFILLIGYLLLILPGVYLSIKYMFSEMALLNENLGPIASLKRSAELTKGYKIALYVKTLGLFGLQLLLLIPLIIFIFLFGNKSMGPVFIEMYGMVVGLIFVFYYLELVKIKGNQPTNPMGTPEPIANLGTTEPTVNSETPLV